MLMTNITNSMRKASSYNSLRNILCANCMGRSLRRMSIAPARKDREGNVIRRQPKGWIQDQKATKRESHRGRLRKVLLPDMCTPKSLSSTLGVRAVDILKLMIKMGENPRTADDPIRSDLASLIATELNFEPLERSTFTDKSPRTLPADLSSFPRRPPLVTVIGHIDHGKTTLLDVLRKSNVVATEAGRITQHIGAFTVKISEGQDESLGTNVITFMDTPGHEAFTSLRERGVKTTDIALLVVAADDGVQEQTVEAIRVAQEAGVQMVVCVTKIDKISDADSQADTRYIREQLFKHGVEVEGLRPGKAGVPYIEVSAKTGKGMDDLKSAIILQAEIMELRAPVDGDAEGYVLESKMEKGRGPLATVLVTVGTIRSDDWVVVGTVYGRVKVMLDHKGDELHEATPGIPVEIIGLKEVPPPGSRLFCVATKEEAERVVNYRKSKILASATRSARQAAHEEEHQLRAEALQALSEETGRGQFNRVEIQTKIAQIQKEKESQNNKATISVIIKADVAGSLEGVQKALSVLPQDEVGLHIVRAAVGPIVEGDVGLAKITGAHLIGFNMKAPPVIHELARKQSVHIIENQVVYSIVDSVKDLMTAMLQPDVVVDVLGEARVKDMFEVNKGTKLAMKVAGCVVTEGMLRRGATAQVVRGDEIVHEAPLDTLRSFKFPVPEIRRGNDCGLSIEGFNDFSVGDIVKCIARRFVPRKLGEKRKGD